LWRHLYDKLTLPTSKSGKRASTLAKGSVTKFANTKTKQKERKKLYLLYHLSLLLSLNHSSDSDKNKGLRLAKKRNRISSLADLTFGAERLRRDPPINQEAYQINVSIPLFFIRSLCAVGINSLYKLSLSTKRIHQKWEGGNGPRERRKKRTFFATQFLNP